MRYLRFGIVSHDWYKDEMLLELSQIVVEGKIRMSGQSWSWVEVDDSNHSYDEIIIATWRWERTLLSTSTSCWSTVFVVESRKMTPGSLLRKGDNCNFFWSVRDSHLKPCLLLRYPGHATWRKYSGVSDQHSESSCSWRKYLKKNWEVMLKDNAARNRIILCTNLAPFSPRFSTGSTRAFVNLDSIWIILGVVCNMSILLRKISGGTFPQVGAHWEHKCPGERFG